MCEWLFTVLDKSMLFVHFKETDSGVVFLLVRNTRGFTHSYACNLMNICLKCLRYRVKIEGNNEMTPTVRLNSMCGLRQETAALRRSDSLVVQCWSYFRRNVLWLMTHAIFTMSLFHICQLLLCRLCNWHVLWRKSEGRVRDIKTNVGGVSRDCFLKDGLICMSATGKLNTGSELLVLLCKCLLMAFSSGSQSSIITQLRRVTFRSMTLTCKVTFILHFSPLFCFQVRSKKCPWAKTKQPLRLKWRRSLTWRLFLNHQETGKMSFPKHEPRVLRVKKHWAGILALSFTTEWICGTYSSSQKGYSVRRRHLRPFRFAPL